MKDWKANSYIYYRWWFEWVGFNFLTNDQQDRAIANMNNADDIWYVKASRKALSQRSFDQRYEGNTQARILGRSGERRVFDYLISKGWTISMCPSDDIRPEFGKSTLGYDIVATHGFTTIKIEVKTMQESGPLWTIGPRCYSSILKGRADYLAIVKGNEIRFCAVSDLRFDEPIYVHDGLNYDQDKAFKYLLVIDPRCLHKISDVGM